MTMLSTFCSLAAGVVAMLAGYYLPSLAYRGIVAVRIYIFSMDVAKSYLSDKGRGFFKEANKDAILIEWVARTVLVVLFFALIIFLEAWLIPSKATIWMISVVFIKFGAIIGTLLAALINILYEYIMVGRIGWLTSIEENGTAHFQGTYDDDFDADFSDWEPDERPIPDRRYFVLNMMGSTGFILLDCNSA